MSKCKFWYNLHYKKRQADIVLNNAKAVEKALETPVIGFAMAAVICKYSEFEIMKTREALARGPECGKFKVAPLKLS